ncbi:hypothetical protein [Pseudoalteromonas sp. MMG022]|uniref:hypothetical protein n=1 Tax=Pseudoalteromonas sp. MMG022 TaxID=2909978 RepID=UPI001F3DAB9A|nr:hypothetical protein [Pseudoalteromonas sp. MMG022]MCF6433985.1 hypothetical protein [Pseudoalteromonas sp. MMG022]
MRTISFIANILKDYWQVITAFVLIVYSFISLLIAQTVFDCFNADFTLYIDFVDTYWLALKIIGFFKLSVLVLCLIMLAVLLCEMYLKSEYSRKKKIGDIEATIAALKKHLIEPPPLNGIYYNHESYSQGHIEAEIRNAEMNSEIDRLENEKTLLNDNEKTDKKLKTKIRLVMLVSIIVVSSIVSWSVGGITNYSDAFKIYEIELVTKNGVSAPKIIVIITSNDKNIVYYERDDEDKKLILTSRRYVLSYKQI